MNEQTAIWKQGLLRDAAVHDSRADDREMHPRFSGSEAAQRLWLGRTDREAVAELRRRARVMRGAAQGL